MTLSFLASATEGRRRVAISAALIIALKNFERNFIEYLQVSMLSFA
jgi:hypothetical protein